MGAVCVAALLVGACGDKAPGSAAVPAAGPPVAEVLGAVVATCADAAGPIEVRRSGATYWEPAAVGVTLRDGDWIRAGDGGSARVRLLAGGHLELGPRSALLVARDATPAVLASSVEGTAVAVADDPPPAEAPAEPATVASTDTGTDTGTYTDVDPPPPPDRPVARTRPRTPRPRSARLPYPQSVSPGVDARVACKPSIALTWQAVPAAAGYRVSIGRDLTFKSIVKFVELKGGKKTSYAFKPLAPGTYAWRVAARGRDGRYGEYGFARRVRCTP